MSNNNIGEERANKFIPISDLSKIISIGKRGIRKLIERDRIDDQFLSKESSPGRGGYRHLINPKGLPQAYHLQYIQHTVRNGLNKHQPTESELPEYAMNQARARIDIIHLLQRTLLRAKEEGRNITPVYHEVAEIYNTGNILEEAFKVEGEVSGYTLQQRWWPAYQQARNDGRSVIAALAPNYNKNRGHHSMPAWYKKEILKILLHPNQIAPRTGIKIVNSNLELKDKKVPCSVRTARRWVNDYKDEHQDHWVFMREGKKALNDAVLPYIDRDWNILDVGEVLIADGHVLNFDVKHPFTGKRHRPTLICFYDGRSRMPVGLSIMPTEDTDNISEALADAVRTLGKFPAAVILDNGRAFKAKHFTGSPDFYDTGLAGLYEQYGIIPHFSKPYHPQSKPIEPFFNQLNERFSKLLPTYRGSSISNQVARLSRNEQMHAKAYQKHVGDWLPTIHEVVNAMKHWSMQMYGNEDHGGLRKGETPMQVLKDGQGPGVPYDQMMNLLLRAKEVRPYRARFTLEGIVYQNWDVLTGWNKPVVVRYTRRVPDKVWVFDYSQGRRNFLCTAYAYEAKHPLLKLTNEDGLLDPTIRERMKQRKRLQKRAEHAAKELYKIDSDFVASPIIPESSQNEPDEINPLPDFSSNPQVRGSGIDRKGHPSPNEERDSKIFEYPYQRFEHIADKEQGNISEEDVAFLHRFIQSESYAGLYEEEHSIWINELLNPK